MVLKEAKRGLSWTAYQLVIEFELLILASDCTVDELVMSSKTRRKKVTKLGWRTKCRRRDFQLPWPYFLRIDMITRKITRRPTAKCPPSFLVPFSPATIKDGVRISLCKGYTTAKLSPTPFTWKVKITRESNGSMTCTIIWYNRRIVLSCSRLWFNG